MRLGLFASLALVLSACVDSSAGELDRDGSAGAAASPSGQAGSFVGGGGVGFGMAGANAASGSGSSGTNAASIAGKGGAAAGGSAATEPPTTGASWVYVSGRQLMVGKRLANGSMEAPSAYRMKCVGWSPTGIGETNTAGYTAYYTKYAAQQIPTIRDLSANTVKTYSPFEQNTRGLAILDQLYAEGVMVVLNVMPSQYDFDNDAYLERVKFFRGHPAILMWQVGNELNFNQLYGLGSVNEAISMAAQAVDRIHATDPDHPVSASWGNAPSANDLSRLPQVDVWSLNVYPHLDMTSRLSAWTSQKPMFIGEYGADAYNATLRAEDQDSQATATAQLTDQIQSRVSSVSPNQPALGGCVFNLTDEWWKAPGTSATTHDAGGFDNSGVYPDGVANEEWWGLLTVDLKPRKAYQALKERYSRL